MDPAEGASRWHRWTVRGTGSAISRLFDALDAGLPAEVRDRLRTFSQAARKSLPLGREEADLWRGFVIAVFRAQAVIDPSQLTDWLVADGWPRESAEELNARFLDQCILLARYA